MCTRLHQASDIRQGRGGDGVGGMDEVCGMGALPSDTQVILKGV